MHELIVVGGGIVGLATAFRYLARFPGRSVLVLEKEPELARHQSSHNSGVLHSGVYYAPGSLKARNCRTGKELLESFCRESGVPFETCGKLIVAVREEELPRLGDLRDRGRSNGVELEEIDGDRIRRLEPNVGGLAALNVPGTGVIDFRAVALAFGERIRSAGGEVHTAKRVTHLAAEGESVRVGTVDGQEWTARRGIVCGGLQADRLAHLAGLDPGIRIIPFLGEYWSLKTEYLDRVSRLIYPVPDPRYQFLGVHLTPRIDGGVDCGPNALPTLAREGYSKLSLTPRDALASLSWPGFWRLVSRTLPAAGAELWRSLSKEAFVRALAELLPDVQPDWLMPGPRGVRAQAIDRQGRLLDDYLVRRQGPLLHLINAPSPAATSCMAIAGHLLERMEAPPNSSDS